MLLYIQWILSIYDNTIQAVQSGLQKIAEDISVHLMSHLVVSLRQDFKYFKKKLSTYYFRPYRQCRKKTLFLQQKLHAFLFNNNKKKLVFVNHNLLNGLSLLKYGQIEWLQMVISMYRNAYSFAENSLLYKFLFMLKFNEIRFEWNVHFFSFFKRNLLSKSYLLQSKIAS